MWIGTICSSKLFADHFCSFEVIIEAFEFVLLALFEYLIEYVSKGVQNLLFS